MWQRIKLSGVIVKLAFSLVLIIFVWLGSDRLGFPYVFQVMFMVYIGLGFMVFVLLDAPPLPQFSGMAAGLALAVFYIAISTVYILGASALPQYNPEIEKEKIEKILKRRRERGVAQDKQVENLLLEIKTLQTNTKSVTTRLARFAPTIVPSPTDNQQGTVMTVVDRGTEVYELYECYNCHKIGGKGSVKKRGPILDNIGSYLTVKDIKRKIFDPGYLYAEGFEKEHKKGRMPDKYKDLMTEEEVMALASYLSTLKNTSMNTPQPIFVKSNVEHGFTVFGYVRDSTGRMLGGIEVHAKLKKEGAHGASGKTNNAGYYEIFLHMHNRDAGLMVAVSAKGFTKEFIANYDSSDKFTKRQQSLDFVILDK